MVVGIPGESDVRFDRDDASLGNASHAARVCGDARPERVHNRWFGWSRVGLPSNRTDQGGMRVGAFPHARLDFRGGLKRLGRVDDKKHGLRVHSRVLF